MLQILGKTMRKKDLTNRLKNYEYCAKKPDMNNKNQIRVSLMDLNWNNHVLCEHFYQKSIKTAG